MTSDLAAVSLEPSTGPIPIFAVLPATSGSTLDEAGPLAPGRLEEGKVQGAHAVYDLLNSHYRR